MAEQPWYFGDMERREAEEKLVNTDTGTFLVRRSNHHDQFVISIRCQGVEVLRMTRPFSVRSSAKHIKIYREEHVFYLHDGKMFNSIVVSISHFDSEQPVAAANRFEVILETLNLYTALQTRNLTKNNVTSENF